VPEALDIGKCVKNLREVHLFRNLDENRLITIAQICELQFSATGEYIIVEGNEAKDLFILLLGEVAVSKQLNLPHLENIEGQDRILSKLTSERRPVLGETALLGHTVRRATVRCLSNCTLYRLEARRLRKLMETDAVIGFRTCEHLCEMLHERLEAANSDIVKLSQALVFALEE